MQTLNILEKDGICLARSVLPHQRACPTPLYRDWREWFRPGLGLYLNFTQIGFVQGQDSLSWTYSIPNLTPNLTDI